MAFNSPTEFLSYLQENYRSEYWNEVDENLMRRMVEHRKSLGQPAPHVGPNHYDPIVVEYWSGIKKVLSPWDQEYFARYVAVGSLDKISLNAACLRSSEGFVAIVLNAGLMTYLNKITKLMVAAVHPEAVIFCNRESPRPLTSMVLRKWINETTEYYRRTKMLQGPVIDLAQEWRAKAIKRLWVWELFVLCHEIGHVLSGHLEREELWSRDRSFGAVEAFQEDQFLELEIQADVLGFIVLREYFNSRQDGASDSEKSMDDRWLIAELIVFFDVLTMLGMEESATHPHPLDRMLSIVANVYGIDAAQNLERSYGDASLTHEVMETPLAANEELCRRLLHPRTDSQ
jgi:hypothetical protein